MNFDKAERIKTLPPYLFAEIDRRKREALGKGVDLIDLGIGDPDMPTPQPIIDKLCEAVKNPTHHRYPSSAGMLEFRQAVAEWYRVRFGVVLDPVGEVLSLIGSKEGIANMAVAFVNPGDLAIVPSPGYPVYEIGTLFNGGQAYFAPLTRENGFLPDLGAIPEEVAKKAKVFWINYPNNPTSAVVDPSFFEELVSFAHRHHIILCHDAAYTEISFDGYRPPSLMQTDGAKDVAIEFHSLSKTFNMTGWRLGMAVGSDELLDGLGQVKSNVDSGVFQAVQEAGVEALRHAGELVPPISKTYQERRDALVSGLRRTGLSFEAPKATFYVWLEVPEGFTSTQFTTKLLEQAGVVCTPGNGFGESGEGYIRLTLCTEKERLREAAERIQSVEL